MTDYLAGKKEREGDSHEIWRNHERVGALDRTLELQGKYGGPHGFNLRNYAVYCNGAQKAPGLLIAPFAGLTQGVWGHD